MFSADIVGAAGICPYAGGELGLSAGFPVAEAHAASGNTLILEFPKLLPAPIEFAIDLTQAAVDG